MTLPTQLYISLRNADGWSKEVTQSRDVTDYRARFLEKQKASGQQVLEHKIGYLQIVFRIKNAISIMPRV
jgi:hypothetical protein